MGNNPNQPPTNRWEFEDGYDDYVYDPTLSCTVPTLRTSTSCILTVVLTNLVQLGPVPEGVAECAGVYKATGLVSAGREVEAV